MITLTNEDYTSDTKIYCINVYVTVTDKDTDETYDTSFDINNNDRLKPYDFIDYVKDNLDGILKDVEQGDNLKILSVNEFAVYDNISDEPYYCNDIEDLYDFNLE